MKIENLFVKRLFDDDSAPFNEGHWMERVPEIQLIIDISDKEERAKAIDSVFLALKERFKKECEI